ncbi:MAG TPA: IMP dehydrogenase [Vicinamibacterales bacterium]|nr:IMP dehydrogenase [Vicinamibacterales bacterium]
MDFVDFVDLVCATIDIRSNVLLLSGEVAVDLDTRGATSASAARWRDLLEVVRGCTFDDFLFAPQFSVLERRDPAVIDLDARLSEHLALRRPIVSANMDTVTRAPMAIVQAEEGGIGIIDRGFRPGEIGPQVREVEIVKRTQHGVILDPYTIGPGATLDEAREAMRRSGVGTLVVVGEGNRLEGLLTERDARFVRGAARVGERMTPAARLVLHEGPIALDEAERLMVERKIKKLPLVDEDGRLIGLVTAKDIGKQKRLPFATRDAQGRLRVGAAIGATGDYLERAAELIAAGTDVIVIDIAHGHSVVMERALEQFRRRFPDTELVAGNVATAEGARFLAERGVNGIKVGIGPGGGCTTRLTTSFGVPQVQALVECRTGLGPDAGRIPIIADGGVRRDGALVQALLFGGDTVMLGSAFAGTRETPGDVVQKAVVIPESQKSVKIPFKVLRGMASIEAIKDRLDVEDAAVADLEAIGAEGFEVSVPERGSARPIVRDMIKHLCSAISYGGAASLAELESRFLANPSKYVIKLSASSRRESYERY